MDNRLPGNKSPLTFFVLVFVLSIPFWVLGAVAGDLTKILPIKLPISALMTFCPFMAAAILAYRQRKGQGVKELLKQSFDYKKIKDKRWYIPIILLMPFIALLSYGYIKIIGTMSFEPSLSFLLVFIFFFVYFIGAIGEELGWSAYVIEPMQNKYGALLASIILGIVWAVWHIIPWSQAHQTTEWIIWQSVGTVFLRIIMVWIFDNTGKSVFAMILFHTMINISPYLIPNYGSHYDPFIFAILLLITVVLVVFLWGTKTFTRFRYA